MYELHEVERRCKFLRRFVKLVLAHGYDAADLRLHLAHVADGLDDVASSRLALSADHRRAFANPTQRLAEIARSADKGHRELRLVDVPNVVGGRKHLRFVDVVDFDCLKNSRLGNVPDAALRHHGNGYGVLDALYHRRIAHARYAARRADVRRYALKRHHRARSGRLGDLRLLRRRHVHYHTALEHLRKVAVQFLP